MYSAYKNIQKQKPFRIFSSKINLLYDKAIEQKIRKYMENFNRNFCKENLRRNKQFLEMSYLLI